MDKKWLQDQQGKARATARVNEDVGNQHQATWWRGHAAAYTDVIRQFEFEEFDLEQAQKQVEETPEKIRVGVSADRMFETGEIVQVFDAASWTKVGDIGDNSRFYREAKILEFGLIPGEMKFTVTVKFLFDGRVSKGHFLDGLRKIGTE